MSVWMEIYEQADEIIKQYRTKKMTPEECQLVGSFLNLKLKAAGREAALEVASYKMARLRDGLKKKRLLANEGTAMGGCFSIPAEIENVKCEQQGGKIITRKECLDYSSDKAQFLDCQTCPHSSVTRDVVLGPKQ
ncbi:MAG: hypothetical protein H7831_18015 [Magnetococcus sp. WYHC-3]